HTPAFDFVHRVSIGTDGATHPGLRPPLSERGEGTAGGRSDSEAVNKNEGRGVSRYETITNRPVSHPKNVFRKLNKS
ncbi:MAG: hypothetical protein IKP34_05105, partial [Bacteroidales bacterium]|nr:hypothetical protein [Bacteroidales bacterium]